MKDEQEEIRRWGDDTSVKSTFKDLTSSHKLPKRDPNRKSAPQSAPPPAWSLRLKAAGAAKCFEAPPTAIWSSIFAPPHFILWLSLLGLQLWGGNSCRGSNLYLRGQKKHRWDCFLLEGRGFCKTNLGSYTPGVRQVCPEQDCSIISRWFIFSSTSWSMVLAMLVSW